MSASHKRLHVLIVDDEEDMGWALQRIVESDGHDSTTASSAEEALRLLRSGTYDLAFVDVKLPDMDGLELVQRMHGVTPALPCVLVSGYFYDDDESVQSGLASGLIQGFIAKPFLLAQVREALRTPVAPP